MEDRGGEEEEEEELTMQDEIRCLILLGTTLIFDSSSRDSKIHWCPPVLKKTTTPTRKLF